MANFLRMAKVMDVNSVDTHSVAGSDVNMPVTQHLVDASNVFPEYTSFTAWASENPLGPLDELPPRPSRPILGYRSSERTADALLKPTRLFQLSIDSQPEYDFGVAQQTWEDCYGDYDDDSHIIAVRDVDNIRHHIPSHPPGELYCTHAGFSGVSSICAEAHQEHQRPELITEVIGEIEEFLFDHKLGDFQEQSKADAHRKVKGPATLRARGNKNPTGPRDIEHARRQQTRLRPDSPPFLGPLYDESAFGTPVIPFLPTVEPRQLLFPSPNSIAYLEHDPSHGTDLDTDDIATVIEAPAGAAGVSQWDEEDSIDFLLGPIEGVPLSVPPHRVLPQPQSPSLNRGVVLDWLGDSNTVSGAKDATSNSEADAPRPRRHRDADASSNDEVDTPCPLCAQDVDARINASIDALVYPIVQPESDFAYYGDDFLHEVMTAVSETRATDLDEQLRLLGSVYPSRILLWPLHHPSTEIEPENASREGDERSRSTPILPTTEELPESPKYFS
ncbi:hypothetical protein CaCOL14_012649 [Colletotrichum acutatum]